MPNIPCTDQGPRILFTGRAPKSILDHTQLVCPLSHLYFTSETHFFIFEYFSIFNGTMFSESYILSLIVEFSHITPEISSHEHMMRLTGCKKRQGILKKIIFNLQFYRFSSREKTPRRSRSSPPRFWIFIFRLWSSEP